MFPKSLVALLVYISMLLLTSTSITSCTPGRFSTYHAAEEGCKPRVFYGPKRAMNRTVWWNR